MKSLIKGKYKLFRLINYLFYVVIFLIGFFFGAFGKNILSFIDIFTIDNAYALQTINFQMEIGNINSTSGLDESSETRIRSKNYISVKPNTNYTLMRKGPVIAQGIMFRLYDSNYKFIGTISDVSGKSTWNFNTIENCYYMRLVEETTNTSNTYLLYDVLTEYIYSNPINVYGGETQEQFESGYNGYTPIWTYDNVTSTQEYMTNEHIYEYLEFITQYLYDNYANEYDFVVSYRKLNENFTSMGGGSGIYISYYKKGELNYIPIYSDITSYDEKYSYFTYEQCMEDYDLDSYCSTQTYISDYGWDFIEIFDEDGNRKIPHEQIYDLLNSYGPGLLTQESRFEEYKKYFPEYADGQKYGEKYFPIRKYKYDENNVPISSSVKGHSPGFMPYSYVKNDLKKATANGMMFYHSTLPLKYMNTEVAWAIGTKLYYSGDIIPTYTTETSSGGNTDFETDFTLDTSWLKENYKKVCVNTGNVIIGRDNLDINNTSIYFIGDIDHSNGSEFYFENYNYLLYETTPIDYNLTYYDRYLIENTGAPSYKMGFTEFNYSFPDSNVLLIKRANYECEGLSCLTIPDPEEIVEGNKDKEFGDNYGLEGSYCFYIDKQLYVSYMKTSYVDSNDRVNSDFTGTIQTPQGIFDVNYQDPDAHNVNKNSPFYQANYFLKMMTPTFGFIGDLFVYFYISIPSIVRYFIYAVLLIILIFWVIDVMGGK